MTQPTAQQYHAALKGVVKRAIIVMDAMGDSEMRFLSAGQVWNRAVGDADLAYGYNEATVRFVPTAREIGQAEVVSTWLTWLGMTAGGDAVRRLVAWAHDDPVWRIADRERCSERTIHYRIDRSVAAILREFGGVEMELAEVDERPSRSSPPNFATERPRFIDGGTIGQHGKVWIDGVGFMKDGRRLNTGQNKISERMLDGHRAR